jgi:hypothetical protein
LYLVSISFVVGGNDAVIDDTARVARSEEKHEASVMATGTGGHRTYLAVLYREQQAMVIPRGLLAQSAIWMGLQKRVRKRSTEGRATKYRSVKAKG